MVEARPTSHNPAEDEREEVDGNTDKIAEYVSSSEMAKRVHQFGGRTRDIISQESLARINKLQESVGRFRSNLDNAEWDELMALKTDANERMGGLGYKKKCLVEKT